MASLPYQITILDKLEQEFKLFNKNTFISEALYNVSIKYNLTMSSVIYYYHRYDRCLLRCNNKWINIWQENIDDSQIKFRKY